MARKLALFGMALAALAIPAVANASPVYTDPPGVPVVAGNIITDTLISFKVTDTPLGDFACKGGKFVNKLTQNSGSSIKEVGQSGELTTCTAGGKSLTITKPTTTTMATSSFGKGTVGISFIADVGAFECLYEGTGTFTYSAASDVLHEEEFFVEAPAEICQPEEGVPVLETTWTRETSDGTPITVS